MNLYEPPILTEICRRCAAALMAGRPSSSVVVHGLLRNGDRCPNAASPANTNHVIDLDRPGYVCTWVRGGETCGARSPDQDPTNIVEAAIAAGWRTWQRDPSLFGGEVLCPLHRDHPMSELLEQRRPPF